MRHAINFFSYGVTLLFNNLGTALRLTGVIWVVTSLVVALMGFIMIGSPDAISALNTDPEGEVPSLAATFVVISFLLNFLAIASISLIWSRFCLGADTPQGAVPSLKGLPFSSYLFSLLLLVVLVIVAALVLGVIETFLQPFLPLLVSALVLPLIITTLIIWFFLRIAAVLPATAAGQVLSIKQAWGGSSGKSIWLLAIIAMLMIIVMTLPMILLPGLTILKAIVGTATSWLGVMIGTGWLVAIFRTIPPVRK